LNPWLLNQYDRTHLSDNYKLALVTGATGAVGPRVVDGLHQAGWHIRALSVDNPEAGLFPQTVDVLTGDVIDQAAVQSAMRGVDAVVHMAALLHLVNPPPALREKYERINVGGTGTVVRAAIQSGVIRVVLFSTIAVYGPSDGLLLNENSPTHPDTFYAQTKRAAEQIVLNAESSNGQPLGTVLRLGAVYGSRIKGNYKRLAQSLARHRFVPVGSGRNRRTMVYDKDVARATVLAMENPQAGGKIYNVSDGGFHTVNDIISTICKALGRKPPFLSLPIRPVRIAAGIVGEVTKILGLPSPISRATIDKYVEDVAVDGRRIQNELGFRPRYDLASGWKETVEEMRKIGEL
jgi:nucleoside-diphosphate-sugar epimerase